MFVCITTWVTSILVIVAQQHLMGRSYRMHVFYLSWEAEQDVH